MASSSGRKHKLPLAGGWSESVLKNYAPNTVLEPVMNTERRKIWETQVMFPYSLVDHTYTFDGPLPDAKSKTTAIMEIFPVYKPCKPRAFLDSPYNFNFIKPPNKELSGNYLKANLGLEKLRARNIKFQYIFYLDETNGQQRNLGLQEIDLDSLAQMTYLFYIIEEDDDHDSPIRRICFPKLKTLFVRKCNKLNYLFPASMCTELPVLRFLMIQEACKLQKIFGGSEENDQKLGIPNLRICLKETEDQSIEEGSTSETRNDPPMQLVDDLKQDVEINVEEGTTSTIAMEDINNLMEEDPLLALVALENLLTGQVSISSIRDLLQELKTLMDSSSDLDHLHQGMLTSDEKDFIEKVQNFFNDNLIKHATSQQLLKKYNQLLDSKTDLMNKLRSAKSAQTDIDRETSTTNAQIHELSLQTDELRKKLADLENQIDGLKSVAKKCDVQKMKLKAECSDLAQQSKELLSALASLEVEIREADRARNLAKEGFANLKSLFPAF
ncbi:hypothetical protein QL285_012044 [Trifolium repens]|nr:hypothetical protein QL285_012044 [Trifolium repens]